MRERRGEASAEATAGIQSEVSQLQTRSWLGRCAGLLCFCLPDQPLLSASAPLFPPSPLPRFRGFAVQGQGELHLQGLV